jgi:hypothetical protein
VSIGSPEVTVVTFEPLTVTLEENDENVEWFVIPPPAMVFFL